MAHTQVYFQEIRFMIEPDGTHVYIYVHAVNDPPFFMLGWHHKIYSAFIPSSLLLTDHIFKNADMDDDPLAPISWPRKEPPIKTYFTPHLGSNLDDFNKNN